MEGVIFLKNDVSKVLREEFIEARLHTDLLGEKGDAIRRVQTRFSPSSRANPVFVVVDPEPEKVLNLKAGLMGDERFVEFLRTDKTQQP